MKVYCYEDGKQIERTVSRMSLDPETVLKVYDKLKYVPNMFSPTGESRVTTLNDFYDPRYAFWLVDDIGLFCLVPASDNRAHVHITFWDRRLRGREELGRRFVQTAMVQYNLRGIFTAVPKTSRATLAYAKRAGFRTTHVTDSAEFLHAIPEEL